MGICVRIMNARNEIGTGIMDLHSTLKQKNDIADRYSYQVEYVEDMTAFMKLIADKSVIPHQVEIQPGRLRGKNLCWMSCAYCYGGSSQNTTEKLSPDRYVDLMNQLVNGPNGGIKKVVFAGYATDPLNYEHIDDLVECALKNGQINGFNTKALRVSDRLVKLLSDKKTVDKCYFNVSVDAGSPQTYNNVHSINSNKDIYHKILENLTRITSAIKFSGIKRDVSASYLITHKNNSPAEIEAAVRDISDAGVNLIRFTFPQVPRGMVSAEGSLIPTKIEAGAYHEKLAPLIKSLDSAKTRVIILNTDAKFENVPRRVFPCLARFVFPTIGYDGYMYHCSQSAAPHFRELSLGNLQNIDFWDAYYNYDTEKIWLEMEKYTHKIMEKLDCRCDRKEQCVNTLFKNYLTENGK